MGDITTMTMSVPQDEHVWMGAIANGDMAAFEALVQRYHGTLYRLGMGWLGNPMDADELTQDVLVGVWQHAHQFRGDSGIGRWLTVMAYRRMLSMRRRQRWRQWVSLDDGWPSPTIPDTSHVVGVSDAVQQLLAALQALDPVSRDIMVLKECEGWTHDEIAQFLHLNEGTVRSKLSRAKATLRTQFPGLGDPDA